MSVLNAFEATAPTYDSAPLPRIRKVLRYAVSSVITAVGYGVVAVGLAAGLTVGCYVGQQLVQLLYGH